MIQTQHKNLICTAWYKHNPTSPL